ncbi:TetR/AcrR family transcriptional regulator [Pseudovibrio exalbescens]|uniref:TetR/AcrR family transcriptional regulator n=1 Tax=Pseudovibrio exalbescens TaxID=197461 RepID=UPI000C9D1033|nr:TetR/AcrR family transcriptional regulator [Pseudovibrio exalbescens]
MEKEKTQEKRQPKYSRKSPSERREILVQAALNCIVRDGPHKLSIRQIAQEAGVSVGLINHHYPSKEELVADAYRHIAASLMDDFGQRIKMEGGTAQEQLLRFIQLSFSPVNLDPKLFRAWLAFWTMMQHSEEVSAVHAEQYDSYRSRLEHLFQEIIEAGTPLRMSPRLAALGLSGLLDGLWLEWSLDPTNFTEEEGIEICRNWLEMIKK